MLKHNPLFPCFDDPSQESRFVIKKLIRVQLLRDYIASNVIKRARTVMLGLNIFHFIPETVLKFNITFVQMSDIAQQLITVIILRLDSAASGSTPFSRTVIKRLKTLDHALPIVFASVDCESAQCS